MLEITVTGWETGRERVRVRGSRIVLLSSSFNLFEHHQKECLCPENQIDTHREHTPYWLISIITTTTLPLECRSFHVSSQQWGHWHWGITKNGECIKEKLTYNAIPQTTTLQCLTSMDVTSCHIWEEDPLVLVRTNFILFSFSFKWFDDRSFWWQGNSHWKHPLETRKKRMVFNVLLLLNTWNAYVRLNL